MGENDFRKPACLAATENWIFRKIISCWPTFTPLTQKWFYTLIFTSNHFRKKRERERERRESPDCRERERERGRTDFAGDCTARRSRRSSIVDRAARRTMAPISPLVGRSHRSRLHRAISSSPPLRDLNLTGFDEFFCWVLFLLWMSVELFIIYMFTVEEVYGKLGM